jgi:hypothetical protein
VTQALSDAGWTTISGTPGSTTAGTDVKMESAANNNGAKIRFRFFDPGTGNCAQVTMKNVAESVTSQIGYALPTAGSGQWRVIAGKFHFFVFTTGSVNAIVARGMVSGGTLYTPTFWSPPADSLGWMLATGNTDTDTNTGASSWRRSLIPTNTRPEWSTIQTSTLVEATQVNSSGICINVWQGGLNSGDSMYRWADDTFPVYEPLIGWSAVSSAAEGKIRGQLYDALVLNSASQTSEGTFSFDGKTWMVITDAPTTGTRGTAALCLAVA